jgi:hypothetical protein
MLPSLSATAIISNMVLQFLNNWTVLLWDATPLFISQTFFWTNLINILLRFACIIADTLMTFSLFGEVQNIY